MYVYVCKLHFDPSPTLPPSSNFTSSHFVLYNSLIVFLNIFPLFKRNRKIHLFHISTNQKLPITYYNKRNQCQFTNFCSYQPWHSLACNHIPPVSVFIFTCLPPVHASLPCLLSSFHLSAVCAEWGTSLMASSSLYYLERSHSQST